MDIIEALETLYEYYEGWSYDELINEIVRLEPKYNKASLYKKFKGNRQQAYVVANRLRSKLDNMPIEKEPKPVCQFCGTRLNDGRTCPVCDDLLELY